MTVTVFRAPASTNERTTSQLLRNIQREAGDSIDEIDLNIFDINYSEDGNCTKLYN